MNKNAIVMAAVVLVVAAGTYYGLEMIAGKPKPGVPEVAEAPGTEAPVEEVVFPESPAVTEDDEIIIEGADEMPMAPDMTADMPEPADMPPADGAPMEAEAPAEGDVPVETPAAPPPEVIAEPVEVAPAPASETDTAAMPDEPAPMDSEPYEAADTEMDMTPEPAADDPAAIAAQAAEQAARVAAEQAAREAARQAVEEAFQQQNQ